MSARPNRGERVYEEVWEILTDANAEEALARRDEALAAPVVLQKAAPPLVYGQSLGVPVSGPPPGFETGNAVFQYKVSIRGRPVEIELVDSDPAGLDDMYSTIARDIRKMVYRPRFDAGEVAITEGVRFSHTFYYRADDLPGQALEAQASAEGNRR